MTYHTKLVGYCTLGSFFDAQWTIIQHYFEIPLQISRKAAQFDKFDAISV